MLFSQTLTNRESPFHTEFLVKPVKAELACVDGVPGEKDLDILSMQLTDVQLEQIHRHSDRY